MCPLPDATQDFQTLSLVEGTLIPSKSQVRESKSLSIIQEVSEYTSTSFSKKNSAFFQDLEKNEIKHFIELILKQEELKGVIFQKMLTTWEERIKNSQINLDNWRLVLGKCLKSSPSE